MNLVIAGKQLDDHQSFKDAVAAHRKSMKNAAASNYVPAAPTGASRPDLACFDRTQLESTIRNLDAGIQGLIDKGDEAVVNLNTGKRWALP
jgi:hypothetical protein